jgi:hypothetical protein
MLAEQKQQTPAPVPPVEKDLGLDDGAGTLPVLFANAAVLHQIDVAYCGSRNLALKAQFQRNMLVVICRGMNLRMSRGSGGQQSIGALAFSESEKRQCLDRELTKRAMYTI